ncbi:MAG TPA: ATP synthase F0 subunit B [Pyrinomonadaceae bacterium]|nr:ATP synthase F0 subunit B [Pyrinomonadaceae bacterium]
MFLLVFADSIQLFPDGTLFIHIALILLMIWVLNRTFFRPISRLIEAREKHKGGHGAEAESIRGDVSEKQARYQQELLAARSEGYELIEKQRTAAVEARTSKLADTKAETAKSLADGKQRVEQETEQARAVIAQEADALAEKISSNILKG